RLAFQELYAQPAGEANAFLKKWYFWATHSRLPPMVEAARMVKRHWDGAPSACHRARSGQPDAAPLGA
ncbi:MAG TPA: transposase, partial [Stellaceae bacterium]|nr:transposase [Stellaceae bacterium]